MPTTLPLARLPVCALARSQAYQYGNYLVAVFVAMLQIKKCVP